MIIEYSLQAFWQGHNCPYQCAIFIPKYQERSENDERGYRENNRLGEVFPCFAYFARYRGGYRLCQAQGLAKGHLLACGGYSQCSGNILARSHLKCVREILKYRKGVQNGGRSYLTGTAHHLT